MICTIFNNCNNKQKTNVFEHAIVEKMLRYAKSSIANGKQICIIVIVIDRQTDGHTNRWMDGWIEWKHDWMDG